MKLFLFTVSVIALLNQGVSNTEAEAEKGVYDSDAKGEDDMPVSFEEDAVEELSDPEDDLKQLKDENELDWPPSADHLEAKEEKDPYSSCQYCRQWRRCIGYSCKKCNHCKSTGWRFRRIRARRFRIRRFRARRIRIRRVRW